MNGKTEVTDEKVILRFLQHLFHSHVLYILFQAKDITDIEVRSCQQPIKVKRQGVVCLYVCVRECSLTLKLCVCVCSMLCYVFSTLDVVIGLFKVKKYVNIYRHFICVPVCLGL